MRLVLDVRFVDTDDLLEHLKEFIEDAVQVADTDEEIMKALAVGGDAQFTTNFECDHVVGYGAVTSKGTTQKGEVH